MPIENARWSKETMALVHSEYYSALRKEFQLSDIT